MCIRDRLFLILLIPFVEFNFQPALSYEESSYTYVKSNLEFLASDELEGREATSRGEKLAALFISEELEKYGVEPYGDSGSYFQDFNMVVTSYSPESMISVILKDSSVNISNGADIVYSSRTLPGSEYSNKEYEMVFAGYGIISENDNYNSYHNLDVNNRVAVVLPGVPETGDSLKLSSETIRKFRRSPKAKAEAAKNMGAVGLIILPNDQMLKYWDYYSRSANSESFFLEEEFANSEDEIDIPIIYFNDTAREVLFAAEEEKDSFINLDNPLPKGLLFNSRISLKYVLNIETRKSRNVIGLIKGNSSSYKGEYVTLGAHYDHVGIQNGEVYNGADDNGSGTVTVLEAARQLAMSKNNGRPVLVIFHSAEEKGLKGAKYLTNNSSFIDSVIVHINVDMVGRESIDSIYSIGASKLSSQFGEMVERVNASSANFVLNYKFDAPDDPNRFYYRSDHVHYANRNIPIVFFYDYMKEDYHKPSDTVDKINFEKIVRMTELIYNLSLELSNMNSRLVIDKPELVN
jgi:hypothetical protein